MKFTKELEQDLIPEWRATYLDYNTGKEKIKTIIRALQKSHRTPCIPSIRQAVSPSQDATRTADLTSNLDKQLDETEPHEQSTPNRSGAEPRTEWWPLRTAGPRYCQVAGSYGNTVATMNSQGPAYDELLDPTIDPDEVPPSESSRRNSVKTPLPVILRRATFTMAPSQVTDSTSNQKPSLAQQPTLQSQQKKGLPKVPSGTQFIRRAFPNNGELPGKLTQGQPHSELERCLDDFFKFLDAEVRKIDSFYQMKEQDATVRLQILLQQLHIMRDQVIQETIAAKQDAKGDKTEANHKHKGFTKVSVPRLKDMLIRKSRFGKDLEALAEIVTPGLQARDREFIVSGRSFTRWQEPPNNEVPYQSAKEMLKHALQEYYRSLELLQAYAYLNRIILRKINAKYDKAVNVPLQRYMSEKVNMAAFMQSKVIESLMVEVEELYAHDFERGSRKIAASKLRHRINETGDYSRNTFRAGFLLMGGVLFTIQALIYAARQLQYGDIKNEASTRYLLQIYGGYFLAVLHVLLFALDCMVWTRSTVNFAFVFEHNSRHTLEWRQLLEIPCFFFFLMGLIMWINFSWINAMYIYWPAVLIGVTVIIVFLPARVLYHQSRKWWAFSNWRLLLAGIYPVEFRDIFLGDMYCSQTYAMGNIALFFCLYASNWDYPHRCNSSHSRLLGFFTCLPSVLRALQCIRRYVDSKNAFPHLLNLGKYIIGVLYYATLSMFRIDPRARLQASLVTFALLNAVYTSVWDLVMDWSLGNPYAKHPLLREGLAFRQVWVYYTAMVLNVMIRFNWIFYPIFTHDIHHSAVLGFLVAASEVCRRGIWSILRVENEHCTNVLLLRASRSVPLPYGIRDASTPRPELDGEQSPEDVRLPEQLTSTLFISPGDVEYGTLATANLHARNWWPSAGFSRVGKTVASSHAQNFELGKIPYYPSSVALAGQVSPRIPDDTTD